LSILLTQKKLFIIVKFSYYHLFAYFAGDALKKKVI
jgi:hypothetical protein